MVSFGRGNGTRTACAKCIHKSKLRCVFPSRGHASDKLSLFFFVAVIATLHNKSVLVKAPIHMQIFHKSQGPQVLEWVVLFSFTITALSVSQEGKHRPAIGPFITTVVVEILVPRAIRRANWHHCFQFTSLKAAAKITSQQWSTLWIWKYCVRYCFGLSCPVMSSFLQLA